MKESKKYIDKEMVNSFEGLSDKQKLIIKSNCDTLIEHIDNLVVADIMYSVVKQEHEKVQFFILSILYKIIISGGQIGNVKDLYDNCVGFFTNNRFKAEVYRKDCGIDSDFLLVNEYVKDFICRQGIVV